jgi:hypothetical protein
MKNIHHLLIPLKYKVSFEDSLNSVKRIDDEKIVTYNYNNRLFSFNSSNTFETNSNDFFTYAFLQSLAKLKKEETKNNNLKIKPTIVRNNWIELKKTLANPVSTLQAEYFYFVHDQEITKNFGARLGNIIIEIIRDTIITKNEKDYIIEKALEYGIENKLVTDYLNSKHFINPAFRKIIYRICEDGILTSNEKKYLIEKASEYNICKETAYKEITLILTIISNIHSIFKNEISYNYICLIYLYKFLFPDDLSVLNNLYSIIYNKTDYNANLVNHNKYLTLKNKIIDILEIKSGFGVFNKTKSITTQNIISTFGIKLTPINTIIDDYLNIQHEEFSKKSIYTIFEKANLDQLHEIEFDINSGISLGNTHYSFQFIAEDNMPLFSHTAKGNTVVVILNTSHYFFTNDVKLKLQIITIISNIIKYSIADEIVEELQALFNPPTKIKLNFLNE